VLAAVVSTAIDSGVREITLSELLTAIASDKSSLGSRWLMEHGLGADLVAEIASELRP